MVEQFIRDWGYLAVAMGAFAEGEVVLLAAGFAAHQGLLGFGPVVAIAIVAAIAGDQTFYWIGRVWGSSVLARAPRVAAQFNRVAALLHRYAGGAIVLMRFLYGLRIAGPIVIGASKLPSRLFFVFNLLGAVLWAPTVAGLGWTFGEAIQRIEGSLQHVELALVGLLAMVLFVWWLAIRFATIRRRRRAGSRAKP